jgi:voltage-gated potassium channel
MMALKYRALLGLVGVIVGGGTVFFRLIEGWSWIDSYFFTVITISTVGYGNLVPVTVIGKIGTTVLIALGIGVIAAALSFFGESVVAARIRQMERKQNTDQD